MQAWRVNGRFRRQRVTGVQRYAQVLTELLSLDHPDSLSVIVPPTRLAAGSGHLWEQAILPWHCRQLGLWSPANTGPLAVSRQVVTLHDVAPLQHPEWFHPAFSTAYRCLIPRLASRVNGILTVSQTSKARILETCAIPADKVRVVYSGVDPIFQPPDPEALAQWRRQHHLTDPYILALGSLEPRKNLAGLLRAWQLIQQRWSDVQVVIAGSANAIYARPDFSEFVTLPRVRWLGYFPEAELPWLYGGATVFAYPSLYEGFGLPIVEAMACGVPVLTGMDGSLLEATDGSGLHTEVTDPEAIAAGLEGMLTDPGRREQYRQQGLERVRPLRWAETAAGVMQAFQDFEIC